MKAKQIFLKTTHGIELFQKKLDAMKNQCKDEDKELLLDQISVMLKGNSELINESTIPINQHQSPT